jgi:hypothetical protein
MPIKNPKDHAWGTHLGALPFGSMTFRTFPKLTPTTNVAIILNPPKVFPHFVNAKTRLLGGS